MSRQANELILSCISWQQAQLVMDSLLAEHLVGSAEILPGQSAELFHVLVEPAEEIETIRRAVNQLPFKVTVSGGSLVQ